MRFSVLTSALAAASFTSARIIGIQTPTVLQPNATFPLTLLTEGYIQSVADIAVAWGFQLAPGYTGAVGGYTGSAYLGPANSNTQQDSVNVTAYVPAELTADTFKDQDVVLTAAVYSLYGASGSPTVTGFNVTVRIGGDSGEIVTREGQAWILNDA